MYDKTGLIREYISSDVKFYTVAEVMKLTGWSEAIVLRMFNDPLFPAADYGRSKIVEAHALIEFFSKRHEKARARNWGNEDMKKDLMRRIRQERSEK